MTACTLDGSITMAGDTLQINGCTIRNNTNIFQYRNAVYVKSAKLLEIKDSVINNSFSGTRNDVYAVYVLSTDKAKLSKCAINTTKGTGVFFGGNVKNAVIDQCQIKAEGKESVGVGFYTLADGSTVTITNSNILAMDGFAIGTVYQILTGSTIRLGAGNVFKGRIEITTKEKPTYSVRKPWRTASRKGRFC